MKRFLIMVLAAVMLVSMPVQTDAATKIPCKIEKALDRAVESNGRAIIVDQTNSRIYLFKKNCKGSWVLKKSGKCIVSQRLCRTKHYLLMRDDDYDMMAWGSDNERWSYGMIVDCYERPTTILIHSYKEVYTGRAWVKDKSRAGNDFGIAVCESMAAYIWKYYSDGTAVMGV